MPSDPLQLSADDLMAPLPEEQRLGGAGPFVINLCTAHTPMDLPTPEALAASQAFVYRVQRSEDRRIRHRLRLGPFATEDDAIAVLQAVRREYPTALTATADGDDLRAIATLAAKANSRPAARPGAALAKETAPKKAAPAKAAAARNAAPARHAAPARDAAGGNAALAKETAPARDAAAGNAASVKAVAGGIVAPAKEALAKQAASVKQVASAEAAPGRDAVAARPKIAAPMAAASGATTAVAVPPTLQMVAAPAAARSAAPAGNPVSASAAAFMAPGVPASAASTPLEDKAPRWYAIQLAVSEKPFDLEGVPKLDILSLYRLYSVAGLNQGRTVYALRLGFFSEETAAEAVAQYLAAYYGKPTVTRVAVAERERFAIQRVRAERETAAPAGSTAYGSLLKSR
jgi:hypothetical protein